MQRRRLANLCCSQIRFRDLRLESGRSPQSTLASYGSGVHTNSARISLNARAKTKKEILDDQHTFFANKKSPC